MIDTINTQITVQLENTLSAKIGYEFADCIDLDPDVISQLLADTRSPNTRRAYEKDLKDFFMFIAKREPERDLVLAFLHLEQKQAVAAVLNYKAHLINKRLAEATVNRRLAAIKSMVSMGRKLGVCGYALEDIKGEKLETYRDTTGVNAGDYAKVLTLIDRSTLKGMRDYAILRLLWDNALRLNEVYSLDVSDFDASFRTLQILGKGKGLQKVGVDLSAKTTEAIVDWIIASGKSAKLRDPLFTSLAYHGYGQRLTGESIRKLVKQMCQAAGITKTMSPHRVRHSAITTVLDKNNGNFREAQKFSRHSDPRTLIRYDDNRQHLQKKMTDLISDLV